MSFGKQKKEEIKPQILQGPGEAAGRSFLTKALDTKFQPYTGQVFGDFPNKDKLLGLQESYVNRPTDPFYGEAQSAISKMVNGEVDPRTSPLYASLREGLRLNQEDAVNEFYRTQNAKGMFDSTGTREGVGRLIADTTNKSDQILGQLYENERARVLPAISAGAGISEAVNNQDLQKAGAISQISAILKGLQEEPLQFAYQQDLQSQLFPYQYQVPIAQGLIANPETFYFPQYSTKKTGIGQLIGGIGGAGLGAFFGGPAGAQAGYGIGSGIGDLIYA